MYPITSKPVVFGCYQKFLFYTERKTGKKLKALKSDNRREHASKEFSSLMKLKEIVAQQSRAYTPQQTGKAERINQTLLSMVQTMLKHHFVSKVFGQKPL